MREALLAWLRAAADSRDPVVACRAAAEAVASDPWAVVTEAGALARAELTLALVDLGLDARLVVRAPDHPATLVVVPEGAPYPALAPDRRRRRGAFDTPAPLARKVVALARQAATGPVTSARDLACGTGAFLVALEEAGIRNVEGIELDPVAAAVAAVAAPRARVEVGDGLAHRTPVDLVVGNPPFVPPERQAKALRKDLSRRFPWLSGRFDLAVPFAQVALDAVRAGGGLGLVLPWSLMTESYARPLRERWLSEHAIRALEGPIRFPGASVDVALLAIEARGTPDVLPNGVAPEAVLAMRGAPLDPHLRPGDPDLVRRIRDRSIPLGQLAEVDTGVVSHGPLGGKAALLFEDPGPDRVPYVDAMDLVRGRVRWLRYVPEAMHRAKSRTLFASPKIFLQRIRGAGRLRAWLDRDGLFGGHTLTVVRPLDGRVPVEHLYALVTSPLVDGLLRIEHGRRLDLYPKDVRNIPVPRAWLEGTFEAPAGAWSLSEGDVLRLESLASPERYSQYQS